MMAERRKTQALILFAALLLMTAASPAFLTPLFHYLALTPYGSRPLLFLSTLIILAMPFAIVAFLAAVVFVFVKRFRTVALYTLALAPVLVLATTTGLRCASKTRMACFHDLAQRSESLVRVIHQYSADQGSPPPSLEALVPNYLPRLPKTGMGAYPTYEYYIGQKALEHYDGNPWVLVVHTPAFAINFDVFMYFPLQNYPSRGYGGTLERVRDWAYVHE